VCRLLEMFREHDADHDGALDCGELQRLLHALSPSLVASHADLAYFHVRTQPCVPSSLGRLRKRWTRLRESQPRAHQVHYTRRNQLQKSRIHLFHLLSADEGAEN
jgi:hypothetical protein